MRFIVIATVALGFAFAASTFAGLASAQARDPGVMAQRQAPVGHRQPQAKDLPPDRTSDNAVSPEDRALDKALKRICRGC